MKTEQLDKALFQKFATEGERLVFWHDPNGEFADYLTEGLKGDLSDVNVLDVAEVGGLSAKLRLEKEDPTGRYLVYSTGAVPPAEEDWLLDIRIYSASFHADIASLWMQELGINSLFLRDHLQARDVFLRNQERRKKLAGLIGENETEATLDLKMMAVLVGSPLASPFDILRALCHGHAEGYLFDLNEPPKVIETFKKMDLLEPFWDLMRLTFTYTPEIPGVAGLLRQIFVSELFYLIDGPPAETLAHYQLPRAGRSNALIFLTHWRDSSGHAGSYNAVAASIASEQKISEPLATYTLGSIKEVYTFWEAEKQVVSRLKDQLLDDLHSVDLDSIRAVASERKAGHWLSGPGSEAPDRRAIADAYDAIVAAAELFTLHNRHQNTLDFECAADLPTAYQEELFRYDQYYRLFCSRSRSALGQGWDLLKNLVNEVERVYDQGFLQPLGLEWSRLLDAGFLDSWSLKDLPAQQDFYANNIRPYLAGSDRKRAFVIISDAIRYEAAQELTESLNGRYRLDANLTAVLGVLPSYTGLGIASLLPHQKLSYTEKGEVLVDGQSTTGTAARNKQLATVQGMACRAEDLLVKKRDDARAFTDGKRVVYIYHNVIDARGDSASTEGETFEAVSDCIAELVSLVQFCVNTLNAANVWVTADHGFLFQQEAPGQTDKSQLSFTPDHAVKSHKRFLLGRALGTSAEAHSGTTQTTAGAEGDMEFWVPRATNRFNFTGGARFFHGGAMPQEVVVPVVTVTQVRGNKTKETEVKKVSAQILGINHKITTPRYRFELIQTEAVSERRKPITLRAAIYEGTRPVTSVESITFDSTSDSMEERKKWLRFELQSGTYDKTTPYRLVLRDAENEAEVQSIPVIIDRSFDDDF